MEDSVNTQPKYPTNLFANKRLIFLLVFIIVSAVITGLIYYQQKTKSQQTPKDILDNNIAVLERVDVETLTIYYNSTSSAALAKNTIESYRGKITNGSLTFEQAGKEISENPTLVSLSSFNKDAYGKYKNVQKNMRVYPDADLSTAIFDAQVGTISPVLEVFNSSRNKKGGFIQQSVGFTIYKVTNHTDKKQ